MFVESIEGCGLWGLAGEREMGLRREEGVDGNWQPLIASNSELRATRCKWQQLSETRSNFGVITAKWQQLSQVCCHSHVIGCQWTYFIGGLHNLKETCTIVNYTKSERVSSGICGKNLYLCWHCNLDAEITASLLPNLLQPWCRNYCIRNYRKHCTSGCC